MNWARFTKNSVLGIVYILALVVVAMYLFFPKIFSSTKDTVSQVLGLHDQQQATDSTDKELRIGLLEYPDIIEPTSLNRSTRTLALQVYEPLVRTNRYLGIEPALALSWGRISPTVWSFELRPNVIFHDNRPLTVDDVAASFRRAANYKNSDLKAMVHGLSIEPDAKNVNVFQIRTEKPDPFLLEKISTVLILPKENETRSTFAAIGTGSYKFLAAKPNIAFMFEAFLSYWGDKPSYKHATFSFPSRREDREKALIDGDLDIATNVPPESVKKLTDMSFAIDTLPSLEVNFLIFNHAGMFKNSLLRKAVRLAIDKKTFVDFSLGYARAVNQYVSTGVFGFNTKISDASYDEKQATAIVKNISSFNLIPVILTFSTGLETAGDYIQKQLRGVGFDPKVNYLSADDFRDSLAKGDSDLYFSGWKSDLGSADDFYENAIHTKDEDVSLGLSNFGHFSNSDIDALIDQGSTEFNVKKRQKIFQNIMQKIVDADYGVPLFESQTIYASIKKLHFKPRIDGYVLASDIQ